MAKINGQITICDRCKKQVFRKCIGEGSADGGYTRWNDFEALPKGWDLVAVPRSAKTHNGNAYNDYLHVCPDCHALWDKVINEHFLMGTDYYIEEDQ